jgi:pilus assembly protein CpaB
MKRRGTILVILSLLLGGVAAWGANNWLQERLKPGADPNSSEVAAAAMAIPYGTKVEGRHIRMIALPPESVPDGAFHQANLIEGKVATLDIARGEILLAERFADHDSGSTLAALVTHNMRAVTVRVDDVVGVAGFLLPGNRVDVVSSRLEQQTRRATSETILTNLRVLAVDQTAATDKNEPVIVRAVTLEMTPSQSEVLVKARAEGTIQLTLRNPKDDSVVVAKTEAPAKRVVVPAAPPVQPTVTVIRGTLVGSTKTKL